MQRVSILYFLAYIHLLVYSIAYFRALLLTIAITIPTPPLSLPVPQTVRLKGGCWDAAKPVFIYTTLNHVKYLLLNGDRGIVRGLGKHTSTNTRIGSSIDSSIDTRVDSRVVTRVVTCQVPAAQRRQGHRARAR